MITKQNYFSTVSTIKYDSLPDALKEGYDTIKYGSKEYSTWEYLEDDEEFLNLYFDKLNAFLSSQKEEKKEQPAPKPSVGKKAKPVRQAKPKKLRPQKTVKKQIAKPQPVPVEKVQEEVRFIKRYTLLHNKEKTKPQVLAFINALQKAITEKRIQKTSSYAKEITHIQSEIVGLYNAMGDVAKVEINDNTLAKYYKIANAEKPMLSISFIKRYIGIHGKTNVKSKAELLFKQLERAAKSKRLVAADPYGDRLNIIYKALNDYITGKTKTPTITQAELNGLMGIAEIDLFAKKKARSKMS